MTARNPSPSSAPSADPRERTVQETPGAGAGVVGGHHVPDEQFTVRRYQPEDETAVLGLGSHVMPADRRAWFEWLARENPAVDDVPMTVLEQGGEVVAAVPLLAVRVRAGTQEGLAFGVTHPLTAVDRDADELARRAVAATIDYYVAAALARRSPAEVDVVTGPDVDVERAAAEVQEFPVAFFAVGTDGTGALADSVPWTRRADRADDYRIQRHGAFVANRIPGPPGRALGAPLSAVTRRVRRFRDRRADFEIRPYTVMCHQGVPAATLGACFDRSRPPESHVVADRAFYDWWYDRPAIEEAVTYVVYRGSEVAAGLVAHREDDESGIDTLHVDSVLPVVGDPHRPDAVAAGMERLLAEQRAADAIRVGTPHVPDAVLDAYGFHSGDRFPTSLFTSGPRTLGLRPLIEGEGTLGHRPIGETAPFLWPLD